MKILFFIIFSYGGISNAATLTCLPHQHVVEGHPRSGYINWKGTYVRDHYVITHCRDNHKSYETWGNSFAEGKPEGWPHKEKFLKWGSSEREEVLDALDKIPKYFSSQKDVKIYRANKSSTPHNLGTSTDNIIVLYDEALKDEALLRRVLLHELAHEEFRRRTPDEKRILAIAAGWTVKKGKLDDWQFSRGNSVEMDSSVSPMEAYANGVEAYFLNQTRLKFKDGILFEFLDQKFGNLVK